MFSTCLHHVRERRAAASEAEGAAESGFTLIELMVVLLILAILLAIAIPTFLGTTNSANDRAAQSNLNTALINAKTIYDQNNQAYPSTALTLAISIASNEPALPMNTTAATNSTIAAGQIGAATSADGNAAIIFSLAKKTNECWWVSDNQAVVGTAAGTPWVATVAPASPAATAGSPIVAGVWYGVYKVNGTNVGCQVSVIATALSNVSGTAFPNAQ